MSKTTVRLSIGINGFVLHFVERSENKGILVLVCRLFHEAFAKYTA